MRRLRPEKGRYLCVPHSTPLLPKAPTTQGEFSRDFELSRCTGRGKEQPTKRPESKHLFLQACYLGCFAVGGFRFPKGYVCGVWGLRLQRAHVQGRRVDFGSAGCRVCVWGLLVREVLEVIWCSSTFDCVSSLASRCAYMNYECWLLAPGIVDARVLATHRFIIYSRTPPPPPKTPFQFFKTSTGLKKSRCGGRCYSTWGGHGGLWPRLGSSRWVIRTGPLWAYARVYTATLRNQEP